MYFNVLRCSCAIAALTVTCPRLDAQEASKDARTALEQSMELPVSFELSPGHGLRQVQGMLKDRPQMGQCLINGRLVTLGAEDALIRWAEKRFEGAEIGQPVFWSPKVDTKDQSHYVGGWQGAPLFVAVCDYDGYLGNQSFELEWHRLVFEFFNAMNIKDLRELSLSVFDGKLDKAAYIQEGAKLEWAVFKKVDQFYTEVWEPWCRVHHFKTDATVWHREHSDDFKVWLNQYTDPAEYPFSTYGPAYDNLTKWKSEAVPADKAK